MKNREVVIGIIVLALLVGAVLWLRACGDPRRGAADTDAIAGTADVGDTLPDLTAGEVHVSVGDMRVALTVTPHPPRAFEESRFRVRAEDRRGATWTIDEPRLSFEMAMPMGDHRYTLVPAEGGWYEAAVVLPRCVSGDRRWYGTFDGVVAGRPLSLRFVFDLAEPASERLP